MMSHLSSSLLTFLKLQISSSLRIGPEVTIKIANVFRKESYTEFMSGCQSTKKNLPSIPHFAIKASSELHEVDGVDNGVRDNDKGSSWHCTAHLRLRRRVKLEPSVMVSNGQN